MPLITVAASWLRLGCIGFGGPPAHIALLRRMCVDQHRWIDAEELDDAIATTNLLPGPASTQLAIYCAWRLRGAVGAVLGGVCFITPGLALILALSAVFLQSHPPLWIVGAAAGSGAAVPAVAVHAAWGLAPTSRRRIGATWARRCRWVVYAAAGGTAAATIGPYLVLVLVACGATEVAARSGRSASPGAGAALPALALPVSGRGAWPGGRAAVPALALHIVAAGGLGALAWEAFKVGALSYGGGFVIVPLMQHDVVTTYHWMSGAHFLDAVALGQVTPGPVVQTVAVVGYSAAGMGGGLVAALVAFAPSFVLVLAGGPRFHQIRASRTVDAFLTGAGPAVVGAIAGSALPLGLALTHRWQIPVLAGALLWLAFLRRGGVVSALLVAGAVGAALALTGVAT